MGSMKWDFLQSLVEKVADLPENQESATPKRQRKKKVVDEEVGGE
jgi:hypothetical protein